MQPLKTRNKLLTCLGLMMLSSWFGCHRQPENEKISHNQSEVNPNQTGLAAQYPLLEHLEEQKKYLLANSEEARKEIKPDGKYLNQKFASGRIALTLGEIDGEPAYFYGRIPGTDGEIQVEFLVYKYSNEELDKMVPGRQYQIDWLETIAFMEPFDEGYHHCFVAYRIKELD